MIFRLREKENTFREFLMSKSPEALPYKGYIFGKIKAKEVDYGEGFRGLETPNDKRFKSITVKELDSNFRCSVTNGK